MGERYPIVPSSHINNSHHLSTTSRPSWQSVQCVAGHDIGGQRLLCRWEVGGAASFRQRDRDLLSGGEACAAGEGVWLGRCWREPFLSSVHLFWDPDVTKFGHLSIGYRF